MTILILLQLIFLAYVQSLAFTNVKLNTSNCRTQTYLHMSNVPSNEIIRTALQKMRGVSVSVEFKSQQAKSVYEIEMLSQELRRVKVASIFVSDIDNLRTMIKEQEGAKGNFPGPCPIIYDGDSTEESLGLAIDQGVTCVVCKPGMYAALNKPNVQVISKVSSSQDVDAAIQGGHGDMFLLNVSGKNREEIQNILNEIPKGSLVIASLDAMQPNSNEISQAKEISTWTTVHGSKISGILISKACIGDAEDLKYASFVVENINKKSSSTFKMTGLTGSSNGHFGSNESGGNAIAKWNRVERQVVQSKVPF